MQPSVKCQKQCIQYIKCGYLRTGQMLIHRNQQLIPLYTNSPEVHLCRYVTWEPDFKKDCYQYKCRECKYQFMFRIHKWVSNFYRSSSQFTNVLKSLHAQMNTTSHSALNISINNCKNTASCVKNSRFVHFLYSLDSTCIIQFSFITRSSKFSKT